MERFDLTDAAASKMLVISSLADPRRRQMQRPAHRQLRRTPLIPDVYGPDIGFGLPPAQALASGGRTVQRTGPAQNPLDQRDQQPGEGSIFDRRQGDAPMTRQGP